MNQKAAKNQSGFSTVEMLIALALAVLVITGVMGVSFGSQSLASDSQTNSEALHKAQEILESALETSRNNYNSVVNSNGAYVNGITYNTNTTISGATECSEQVTSQVSWTGDHNRPEQVNLTSDLTNVPLMLSLGGDCITVPPSPNEWLHPSILSQPSGLNGQATGLDVSNKIVFLSMIPSGNDKPNFYVVDTSLDVNNPKIYSLNTVHAFANQQSTLNAVDFAHSSTNNRNYAYVANSYFVKDKNCNKDYSKQLQVIDVTDIANPTLVATRDLSTVDGCGQAPAGYSIYYYNNKVYIGTQDTKGNDLTIFDVTEPTAPNEVDSIQVNRNVNAIVVRNGLAYLATGSGANFNNPLKIYDVNPSSPTYKQQVGSFITHIVKGQSDIEGTSLYLFGTTLYLGRDKGAPADAKKGIPEEPDFYILNVTTPSNITVTASKLLGFNSTGAYLSGIRVASGLAFIGIADPNNPFEVWDVPALTQHNIGAFNFSQGTTGVDYENNLIYTSNISSNPLTIIKSTP